MGWPTTAEELAPYRAFARQQEAHRRRALAARLAAAHATARRAAALLKRDFGAQRVVLFGSVARAAIHEHSDIDLAVAGIPSRLFERAWASVEALAPDFRIDLVELERVGAALGEMIAEDGVDL